MESTDEVIRNTETPRHTQAQIKSESRTLDRSNATGREWRLCPFNAVI